MFKGSIVALVTPFKNGMLDKNKLKELVEWHIKNNTSAIIPCGTTGESATLTHLEHNEVIEIVVEAANKKIPIIAGTGSNNTKESILLSQHAQSVGADGILMITPYYNKPSQNGIYEHFKVISENINIPIMLYNIASRTGVNMSAELIYRLSKLKNIVAIKEASGNINQISDIIEKCDESFVLMSGDDALTLPVLSLGGTGVVSVLANIAPRDVSDMVKAFQKGDIKKARELHYKLSNLVKAMFLETNPVPIKTAMEILGICSGEVRLPMYKMDEKNIEKLKIALKNYGLI
ncbi:MAG: 4-hydroxy-tetrahydrodipicolinate synthase [Elusimicrobiota bacterium]|jgi:4-hydroxy-tetrahydrodipicolinate synthase|nr:4-hydroxy-tetrahydrodipicolinate synthase [Elusimicrobiota bacterium]